ncbi:phytanoyl-CoA dioxygenase family protein [Synechococcus sp. A15-127]|uniref:phytanoyl-CoA dioxygenase family protein n=1 Tax=Synechococcus sp. A15-127 TaxID=1050624 RepID=UPI001648D6FA|nr:phytanoyl-CoA dioxygenase family protein [Synechococcus sp. A15-127]
MTQQLAENGFVVMPLSDTAVLDAINACIAKYIGSDIQSLCSYSRDKWHESVYTCQVELNNYGILHDLIALLSHQLESSFSEKLAWVNVLKLRAVRPCHLISCQDHVPFHRESLYAVTPHQVKHQYNIWIPCSRSATSSGLLYFPNSHLIDDVDLQVSFDNQHPCRVNRYSNGHAIGFPYLPKIIKNLPHIPPKKIEVPVGCVLIFSAMLIHGNGINKSDQIRYSVDTGIIPQSILTENDPLHAAGGQPHYLIN